MGTILIGLICGITTLGIFCIIMSLIYESDHVEYTKLHKDILNNNIKYDDYEVNAYTVIIEEPTD